jgi:large subunit ribosomal protein L19
MTNKSETFDVPRSDLPQVRVGDTIKLYYKFVEKDKERIQPFEGTIIAKKGSGISETMTIRGSLSKIMMEKIIPVHSPNIDRIELIKRGKVRRAKLYYLRSAIGKRARLKRKEEAPVPKKEE